MTLGGVILILLVAPVLAAQAPPPLGAKVGIVDFAQAVRETRDAKAVRDSILYQFARSAALLRMQDEELQAERQRLNQMSTFSLLPGQRRAKKMLARNIESQSKSLQRQQEAARLADHFQQAQLQGLGKQMSSFLEVYARKYGYLIILRGQVVNAQLAAAAEDLTADVVKRFDEASHLLEVTDPPQL